MNTPEKKKKRHSTEGGMNWVWPGAEESQQSRIAYMELVTLSHNILPDDNGQQLHWSDSVFPHAEGLIRL